MSDTRSVRQELMGRDDGADSDTVYLRPTNDDGSRRRYHTADCTRFEDAETPVEHSRLEAQRRGHPPCKRCVLGGGDSSANAFATRECPMCGETVKRLPHHLRWECVET